MPVWDAITVTVTPRRVAPAAVTTHSVPSWRVMIAPVGIVTTGEAQVVVNVAGTVLTVAPSVPVLLPPSDGSGGVVAAVAAKARASFAVNVTAPDPSTGSDAPATATVKPVAPAASSLGAMVADLTTGAKITTGAPAAGAGAPTVAATVSTTRPGVGSQITRAGSKTTPPLCAPSQEATAVRSA